MVIKSIFVMKLEHLLLPLFKTSDENNAPNNPPKLKRFKTQGTAQLGLLVDRWLDGASP